VLAGAHSQRPRAVEQHGGLASEGRIASSAWRSRRRSTSRVTGRPGGGRVQPLIGLLTAPRGCPPARNRGRGVTSCAATRARSTRTRSRQTTRPDAAFRRSSQHGHRTRIASTPADHRKTHCPDWPCCAHRHGGGGGPDNGRGFPLLGRRSRSGAFAGSCDLDAVRARLRRRPVSPRPAHHIRASRPLMARPDARREDRQAV
jgi:hypothetical protein